MMNRGIDHLVLCGSDLDVMASIYERLGFTLTPKAQHPFGTGNQLAQMDGDFLELLSVTQPQDIPEALPGAFSFGAYTRDFLKTHQQGFSMLALKSRGWQADRAHFKSRGFDLVEPFEFSRLAKQPDGAEVTVGFKLTFAIHPDMPWAVFFTCDHQHEPQYFCKPQFQKHANTATGISEVMMVASRPTDYTDFFEGLFGDGSVTQYDDSLSVSAGAALISVSPQTAFSERFLGATSGVPYDPRFMGYGISVQDIEAAENCVLNSGLACQRRGKSLWLSGLETGGVVIEFSEATAEITS